MAAAEDAAAKLAKIELEHQKIWDSRRSMIRGALVAADSAAKVRRKLSFGESAEKSADDKPKDARGALVLTAFAVAAGAATIRIGGRAALMSALGLDFVQVRSPSADAVAYISHRDCPCNSRSFVV
jgi:hypothetical protein